MFPFKRSCELSFKVEDDPLEQNNLEDQILLANNSASVGVENIINLSLNTTGGQGRGRGCGRGRGRGRGRRPLSLASSSSNNNIDENEEEDKKRVFHREIERQRRQEMSTLFSSLRSVIPAEHLKGRRSITDHLAEATNYIKDLEKDVKELGNKRDQLKQQALESTSSGLELGGSSGSFPPYSVLIRQFAGGLDIEISVKYGEADEEFLLSTALQVILEERLEVLSSTSTRFHGRLIHSIQCEVRDIEGMDFSRLEQRLKDIFHGSNNED